MSTNERKFGRIESPDDRDKLFPVSAVLASVPPGLTQKYWWADGWWGDQGTTSECTAYSWMHWVEDGPVVQDHSNRPPKPLIAPKELYTEAQKRDPWEGEAYDGSSVRAVAKCLLDLGVISTYRWATNVQDVVNTVLTLGPMVVGTKWYGNMNEPGSNGVMRLGGRSMGGHAYVINGVDTQKNMFRIKNSWGKRWGKEGFAFISIDDFDKLLADGGEACIAFENKVTESLNWGRLRPPGIYRD